MSIINESMFSASLYCFEAGEAFTYTVPILDSLDKELVGAVVRRLLDAGALPDTDKYHTIDVFDDFANAERDVLIDLERIGSFKRIQPSI